MSSKTAVKKKAATAAKAVKKAAPVKAEKPAKEVKPAVAKVVAAPAKTDYEIETDAYFPPRMRAVSQGRQYPFASIAVGQSFFEPTEPVDELLYSDKAEAELERQSLLKRTTNRVSAAKRRFMKLNPGGGYQFAMRALNDPDKGWGVRVRREA